MAWAEEEDDATRGQELHCRCGVVCSRAVKAVMREADKLAARADKYEMAQISEQLLENATVRHFLLAFEEQDWPELLQSVATIGIQALSLQYGRSQLGLGSLRMLAKWIERHRTWPSLDVLTRASRTGRRDPEANPMAGHRLCCQKASKRPCRQGQRHRSPPVIRRQVALP
ncbi:unnamed protein product [Effrenium voratum]|uniref:Uncharacterized protein n=1 Tax=Effrenium voratum TaxID=2562239 RepID=A0AA36MNS3_9DINO|nr:unnamed protein product [Effrenium voratum]CAJ1420681.1 unnamed protein product [Effrenium voratum]